jgi:hypothetical protein
MGEALTQVTAQTEGSINYGLLTFPFTDDDCSPGDMLIDVAPLNAAAIADVVGGGSNDIGTSLGTPTAESLLIARQYLDSLDNGLDSYVLLANDGAPNCNDSLDASTCRCSVTSGGGGGCQENWWCLDDANTTQAAAELNAAGYPVYVLGIGDSMEWADVMDAIALAGGTGSYIPADSADFEEVLLGIVGGIMSCDFDVDWDSLSDSTAQDPDKVNLYCKQDSSEANNNDLTSGNVIPKNDGCAAGNGGWTWADNTDTTIHMCDDMCETVKSGGCPVISAAFGCESVDIVPIK